jgi:heat shock protein HslJ
MFFFALFICGLLGCNSQKNINKNMVYFESITDKEWVAIEIDNKKIELSEVNQFPRLKLSEGKISGFSACNRMNGTYTMEKEKISFGSIAVTKMLCFETQDIETKYLKALTEVAFWKYEQNKLYFMNTQKQIIIVFE